ncbi:NtrC family transcriptional regulator [Salmonella enterica subsp. indica]|uniref:NtrC family transcriptional regulator n=1 Tax=Salmonella enterica subsp. indica TaxID=59207 RepID=A0A379XIP9_SALER|nr:NtrC family transcriptional regulator [Salmonella enterica subsp. indica]
MLICATVTSPPAETLAILKNKLSSIFEYGLYSRDSVAHPPCYGDQIEERVTLLIGCVEQVFGLSATGKSG